MEQLAYTGFTSVVPCDGCTKCCKNDMIRVLPHEDASRWQTVPHPYVPGARMLDHKANADRDCIYLGKRGCTIHADRPQVCREMDCRRVAMHIPYEQAIVLHDRRQLDLKVWLQGKALQAKAPILR